jgi:hypothetical protein
MRMPKFTAEVSLYKMNRHYQRAEVWAGNPSEQVESAQLLMPPGPPHTCNGDCPPPHPCKPHIGPCRPDPSSSTGYSRCITDIDCTVECGIECTPPQKYACSGAPNYTCAANPNGQYSSLSACQSACHVQCTCTTTKQCDGTITTFPSVCP